MAFYSQTLSYYATSFECEKGLFRAQLGLWLASPRRLSSDLVSNRLGSRSISGWEADQFHKCVVWQARGFCTPQPRICAPCTNMLRAHACAPSGCKAPCNFWSFCIVLTPFCAVDFNLMPWMTVFLCWWCGVLVALCGRNFSDNRCPLMDEVRSKTYSRNSSMFLVLRMVW